MKISSWSDTENEKHAILELTKNVFGDVEIASSLYFDWQYRMNPDGKALVLLTYDDSGQVIGTNTIVPSKLLVDGEEVLSSLACNVQVHKNYQKKGIFSSLLTSMSDYGLQHGVSSLFAVPNDNSFNAFISKGSVEITKLPLLVRPIKLSEYFNTPIKQILKPFDIIWKKNAISSDIKLFSDEFDESFESLTKKMTSRISVVRNRNKKFLNWRYKMHPTRKYQTFVLQQNDILVGYIVAKIHDYNNKRIGVILDYVVDSDFKDREKLKDLIYSTFYYFWQNNASIAIVTSRNGLLENSLLHDSGFFSVPSFLKPESLHFIVQVFENNTKQSKLKKYDNWFFMFGDYDVF